MQDEAIKFEAIYQEVELAIERIKELGIDTGIFKKQLLSIRNTVKTSLNSHVIDGFAEACYTGIYAKGITALNKLKIEIEKYDKYVKIYNSCCYIETLLDDDMDNQRISELVSKMISNLSELSRSGTMCFDSEKMIVEKAYEVAYKLIKFEIIKKSDSQLFLYIKNSDTNRNHLNGLIARDIDNLKPNKALKKKLYAIKQNGIYSDFIDLDLIMLILMNDKSLGLGSTIEKRINALCDELLKDDKKIIEGCIEAETLGSKKDRDLDSFDTRRKQVRKRTISAGLVLSLIITGGVAIERVLQKLFTYGYYDVKTTIYSSVDDTVSTTDGYEYSRNPLDKTVKICVYDEYSGEGKRNYLVYDVSSYDFDAPKEYYEYGVENFKVFPESYKQDSDKVASYHDGYTNVVVQEYEYIDDRLDGISFAGVLTLAYLIYILMLMLIEFMTESCYYSMFELINPSDILDDFRRLKERKDNYKQSREYYKGKIEILLNEINKNEVLRQEFLKLYEQNKYLLTAPEELEKRIIKLADNEKFIEGKKRSLARNYKIMEGEK